MSTLADLENYLKSLCPILGHVKRHKNFCDYVKGLLLVKGRKSVEPMAAALDPLNTRSRHQAMHHFVADSPWSDQALLDKAWSWVDSQIAATEPRYWLVDDTGMPKKGTHSVGVSHQYCGQVGETTHCQVAVSVSLASQYASIPVAWRLYLPKTWTDDPVRCAAVGIPKDRGFATKVTIALEQLAQCRERGIPTGMVLADADYGNNHVFREGLEKLDLSYVVGVKQHTSAWGPGVLPLKPEPNLGKGRQRIRIQYTEGHRPESLKTLAMKQDAKAWQTVEWREGTNETLRGRFTALRVRAAHRDHTRRTVRPEQWLLIEWPPDEPEPTRYWFSNLPESISLKPLVYHAKMRWPIERDYQELKDELGLNHYEGRSWRGFHHHMTLCTVAYAYLVAQRLARSKTLKKTVQNANNLPYPKLTSRRFIQRAQRHVRHSIATLHWHLTQMLAATSKRCPCCAAYNLGGHEP